MKTKDRHDSTYDPESLESVEVLYQMLRGGELPDGMTMPRGHQPRLTAKKAMSVIWFLQEQMGLIPDHYEACSVCEDLFDTWSEGTYVQSECKHYCGNCRPDEA